MSECVVRMEMPTENTVCELNYYSSLYREWRCTITDKRCNHNKNGMFPSWCPIICSLPDGHGRLIDASYVIDVMQDELDNDVHITVDDCFQIECKIPTIVPAEAERSETCLD